MCMCAGMLRGGGGEHACYSLCVNVVRLKVNGPLHQVTPKDETQIINLGGMLIKSGLFIIGQCSAIRPTSSCIYLPIEGQLGCFQFRILGSKAALHFKVWVVWAFIFIFSQKHIAVGQLPGPSGSFKRNMRRVFQNGDPILGW